VDSQSLVPIYDYWCASPSSFLLVDAKIAVRYSVLPARTGHNQPNLGRLLPAKIANPLYIVY